MNRKTLLLRLSVFLLALLPLSFGLRAAAQIQPADLALVNGRIATVESALGVVDAIAMRGEQIVAVGSNAEIQNYIGNATQVIDLDGRFAMPGFIEGHAHFIGLGESMMMLKNQEAKSWQEVIEQVERAVSVTPPGQWITGRGWHQSKWSSPPENNVDGYPTHDELSKISPDNPVLLRHASGHMSFANDYAMRLAGVDKNTKDPAGGEILRNEAGEPIGVFRETAQGLISRAQAVDESKKTTAQRAEQLSRAIQLATEECLQKGVTSFQDAGTPLRQIAVLKSLAENGQLGIRLWVMVRDQNENMEGRLKHVKMIGFGNNRLTVRALKRSIDGALGPHGAWLLAPYSDMPTSSGLNTATVESVKRTAELAIENDFQMCVHAIGDRANREVLDIFAEQFQKNPSRLNRRWRVEHAQHLDPADIPRFSELGVIASMQGVHCTSDAVFVPKRLGMRRSKEGAYVWRSLIDSGAVVTNGTDAPVEDVNPLPSFYASVTRQLADGVTFFPEQVMTREEALRSYTIDCAYAAFEENLKGSLLPGKLGDVVVLSHNLLDCPAEDILKAKVEMTVLGGKLVYRRPQP